MFDRDGSAPIVMVVSKRQIPNLSFDKVLDTVFTYAFYYALAKRIQRRSNEAVLSVVKNSGIRRAHESPLFNFRCFALPVPQRYSGHRRNPSRYPRFLGVGRARRRKTSNNLEGYECAPLLL